MYLARGPWRKLHYCSYHSPQSIGPAAYEILHVRWTTLENKITYRNPADWKTFWPLTPTPPNHIFHKHTQDSPSPILWRGLMTIIIPFAQRSFFFFFFFWGGWVGILVSVRPSVHPSVCPALRVCSVAPRVPVGSISYLCILSSNIRCVACKVWIFGNFLKFVTLTLSPFDLGSDVNH